MRAVEVGSNSFDLARAAQARNTPTEVVSHLVRHEGDHAREDTEGYGVFGLLLVTAVLATPEIVNDHIKVMERHLEIVVGAFYRPIGDRTPETMVNIASAPGYADMSGQDWNVYNHARSEDSQVKQAEDERLRQQSQANDSSRESDRSRQNFKPGAHGVVYPLPAKEEDYASLPLAA